jgi:hypothetical protein
MTREGELPFLSFSVLEFCHSTRFARLAAVACQKAKKLNQQAHS